MKIHITNLNNIGGTATIAQRSVTKVAKGMGFKELGIFNYTLAPDFMNELPYRLNGTFAGFEDGDVMILQYPSWMGLNYDEMFIDRVRSYPNSKLIIFVEDVQQLMFDSEDWILKWEVELFNKADLLILPSPKMRDTLMENGLREDIPVEYQVVWEMVGNHQYTEHEKNRKIFFPGDMKRFSFLYDYHGETQIEVFQWEKPERSDDYSFKYGGFFDTDTLNEKISEGGFGLIWANDDYFERYYSMNQPHKLGNMLSCGIPVIVRKGCAHEEFITKHGLGFAVNSLEEADEIVDHISDAQFDELYANVKSIQTLMINGTYTRMVLQNALTRVMEIGCKPINYVRSNDNELKVNVINNEKSVEYLLNTKCSVARFGDGEFDIIAGRSIPYQTYNENLANELRMIAGMQSDEKFMVCMPDVFENRERYNDFCRQFWEGFLKNNKRLLQKVCKAEWYGSTNLSRPYMDLADKTVLGDYFDKLKKLWEDKDILIVEGSTSRSGIGNDLFTNAKSIKRIIGPSRDAYSRIRDIENEIRKYGKNKLILLMLGPTAKVISYHMHKEGFRLIDLGHIDSEYEWYRMGATEKVKLENKHTAEHNYDENITFDNDEEYIPQIISRVESRRK